MVVKQVFDHSLRAYGKRFLSSLKASNRYSEGYLASLETTVAMSASYAEEQEWPGVRDITVVHIEDYLATSRTELGGSENARTSPRRSFPRATSMRSTVG